MWKKGKPSALLVGMKIGATTKENRVEIPQKIKNGIALWTSHSTSENISKETQNTNSKEFIHHYVHRSIMYYSQEKEATQVLISTWVDKNVVVHISDEI